MTNHWKRWFRYDRKTKSGKRWLARTLAAVVLGIITATAVGSIGGAFLTRLGLDLLFPLRYLVEGQQYQANESKTAVILLDEETYQRPPFRNTPKVAWTPYIADVLNAVSRADASLIGLDLVFPTTLDQPNLKPGHDRSFLKALNRVARNQELLLGQVELSKQPIRPTRRQIIAGGGTANLASLRIQPDPDDVVRRYLTGFDTVDGGHLPTLSSEIARRAGVEVPSKPFLINFNAGGAQAQAFSLADLHACARQGRVDFFRKHFAERVVLLGTGLDVEDRHLTSQRFSNQPTTAQDQPRCVYPQNRAKFGAKYRRRSTPGVMIHAAAAETLLRDRALHHLDTPANLGFIALLTALLALALFAFGPAWGLAVLLMAALLESAGSLALFQYGLVAPLVGLAFGWPIAYAGVYSVRYGLEEKEKRRIRHAFQHYLSPALVERLAADPDALRLGGQSYRVTVLFADIAGYTTLSERMADQPESLVDKTNEYLSRIVTCVESQKGYVDKFMGDAVMAVWGAPVPDADQAEHAVDAALAALARFDDTDDVHIRIGINTGIAVAGNMGAARRFNYTVTGDPVNLAARLEAANKFYSSRLLIGENTKDLLSDDFVTKPLDNLRVKGKERPVTVYQVMGRARDVSETTIRDVKAFKDARMLYLDQHFDAAEKAFQLLADAGDEPARIYIERCQFFQRNKPPEDWDGTYSMDTK